MPLTQLAQISIPQDSGSLLLWLFEVSSKSTVIFAVAIVLCLLLRSAAARVRYMVWSTALLGVLCVPLLAWIIPNWQAELLPERTSAEQALIHVAAPVQWITDESEPLVRPILSRTARFNSAAARHEAAPAISDADGEPAIIASAQTLYIHWTAWVVVIWCVGGLFVLGWLRLGMRCANGFARAARPLDDSHWTDLRDQATGELRIRRSVKLLSSKHVATPMTWGFFRPIVLMPASAGAWPRERQRLVLLHELVHVKRFDWPIQILAQLACAMYWFHPLAWVAVRRLAIERELSCDDNVLSRGARPSEYASHLLEIARSLTSRTALPVATLTMATRSKLEGRLISILRKTNRNRRAILLVPAVLLLASFVLALASLHPWGHPAKTVRRAAPQGDLLDARGLFLEGRWAGAAEAFERAVAQDESNGQAWFNLAYARYGAGQLKSALRANLRAAEFPRLRGQALYNAACAQAMLGRADEAIDLLSKSIESGYVRSRAALLSDPDLNSLHEHPRFAELLRGDHSVRQRFESLADAGDSGAIAKFWSANPQHAFLLVRTYLEGGLTFYEAFDQGLLDADTTAIDELHQLARRAASSADQVFGDTRLSAYVQSVAGWDARQRREHRESQRAYDGLRWQMNCGKHDAALKSGLRAERLARSLGDSYVLAKSLLGLAAARDAIVFEDAPDGKDSHELLVAALDDLTEARAIWRQLRQSYAEAYAMYGMADLLVKLDRIPAARKMILAALEAHAQLPISKSTNERIQYLRGLWETVEKL